MESLFSCNYRNQLNGTGHDSHRLMKRSKESQPAPSGSISWRSQECRRKSALAGHLSLFTLHCPTHSPALLDHRQASFHSIFSHSPIHPLFCEWNPWWKSCGFDIFLPYPPALSGEWAYQRSNIPLSWHALLLALRELLPLDGRKG